MDISVKTLQEAISIRRQIDDLEKRLSSILAGAPAKPTAPTGARYFSPGTRAKLAAAAKARWARQRGATTAAPTRKKKGQLTPAGRRKLSQLMKARWAARRKAAGAKPFDAFGRTMEALEVAARNFHHQGAAVVVFDQPHHAAFAAIRTTDNSVVQRNYVSALAAAPSTRRVVPLM